MLIARHVNTKKNMEQENTLSARYVNTKENLEEENMLSATHANTMQHLKTVNTLNARHVVIYELPSQHIYSYMYIYTHISLLNDIIKDSVLTV
jgi:hypothetical protein